MNLLSWTPTHHQHLRTRPLSVLATAERLLQKVLLPIEQEPEGRLADALAALLAALEAPPEPPIVAESRTRRPRHRASEMRLT